MLGIIGVVNEEVTMIKAQLADAQVETRTTMDFYRGKLERKEVAVVHSEIGKVNAAMCIQILADVYGVTGVVNTGIAGSLKAEIDIGDIVLSSDVVQRDMGATRSGYEPGRIPRMETLAFRADEGLMRLAGECYSEVSPDIHTFVGRVVAGGQFTSDKGKKKWLTDTFGGCYTEMEGAAIAQACYLNSIPFLIVKAIPNKTDDSATVDYPASEAKATIHNVNLLTEIIRPI